MVSTDLVRDLALQLERMQRSPPEAIILDLRELAELTEAPAPAVRAALEWLGDMSLIEGPGEYGENWIFRRLTVDGRSFVDEVRDPKNWSKIKQHYVGLLKS